MLYFLCSENDTTYPGPQPVSSEDVMFEFQVLERRDGLSKYFDVS
jgi:hypothetical protein